MKSKVDIEMNFMIAVSDFVIEWEGGREGDKRIRC